MRKFKTRSFVYDALFVVLVVVAAMASAVIETGAVLGGLPALDAVPVARSSPSKTDRQASAGAPVDGALVSVATPGSAR